MMHGVASDTVPPLEGMMANLSSVLAQAAADMASARLSAWHDTRWSSSVAGSAG